KEAAAKKQIIAAGNAASVMSPPDGGAALAATAQSPVLLSLDGYFSAPSRLKTIYPPDMDYGMGHNDGQRAEATTTPAHSSETISNGAEVLAVADLPMADTLHDLVAQAAASYTDRRAVCFQPYDKTPVYVTYLDVLQRAEELTLFLKSHTSDLENQTIGLYCHQGIHLPSWILGILRVPAAYSPLDPGAPSSFTSSLIQRCKIRYILVEEDKVEVFKLSPGWIIKDSSAVRHLHVTLFEAVKSDRRVDTGARNEAEHVPGGGGCIERSQNEEYIDIRDRKCLAYVLHTSGTTGIPKIVSVPHCCIVPNILHLR
ncbi:unnamed protein product, partial [Ranitomeya imitator]